MLIHLLDILYNFKDERRRYTRNKPLGLDECLSTSLKDSPSDCVRYSRSDLFVSLGAYLDGMGGATYIIKGRENHALKHSIALDIRLHIIMLHRFLLLLLLLLQLLQLFG
jgi:hypothetical protein